MLQHIHFMMTKASLIPDESCLVRSSFRVNDLEDIHALWHIANIQVMIPVCLHLNRSIDLLTKIIEYQELTICGGSCGKDIRTDQRIGENGQRNIPGFSLGIVRYIPECHQPSPLITCQNDRVLQT